MRRPRAALKSSGIFLEIWKATCRYRVCAGQESPGESVIPHICLTLAFCAIRTWRLKVWSARGPKMCSNAYTEPLSTGRKADCSNHLRTSLSNHQLTRANQAEMSAVTLPTVIADSTHIKILAAFLQILTTCS